MILNINQHSQLIARVNQLAIIFHVLYRPRSTKGVTKNSRGIKRVVSSTGSAK